MKTLRKAAPLLFGFAMAETFWTFALGRADHTLFLGLCIGALTAYALE